MQNIVGTSLRKFYNDTKLLVHDRPSSPNHMQKKRRFKPASAQKNVVTKQKKIAEHELPSVPSVWNENNTRLVVKS